MITVFAKLLIAAVLSIVTRPAKSSPRWIAPVPKDEAALHFAFHEPDYINSALLFIELDVGVEIFLQVRQQIVALGLERKAGQAVAALFGTFAVQPGVDTL